MPDEAAGSSGVADPAVAPAAAAGEVPGAIALLSNAPMGTFDENGKYIPRSIVEDDLGGASLEDAIDPSVDWRFREELTRCRSRDRADTSAVHFRWSSRR